MGANRGCRMVDVVVRCSAMMAFEGHTRCFVEERSSRELS